MIQDLWGDFCENTKDLGERIKAIFQKEIKSERYQASLDFDSLRALLPYRLYDEEYKLFINDNSVGFGLEFAPLTGANDALVTELNDLILRLPERDTDIQMLLVSHNQVAPQLRVNRDCTKKGEFAEGAEISYRFNLHVATHGYETLNKSQLSLRDVKVFIFLSKPLKGYRGLRHARNEMHEMRSQLEGLLVRHAIRQMTDNDFLTLAFMLINPNTQNGELPRLYRTDLPERQQIPLDQADMQYDPVNRNFLRDACVGQNYESFVEPDYMDIHWGEGDDPIETRMVTLNVEKWPTHFCLWQFADSYCDQFSALDKVSCPFVMNLTFRIEAQETSKTKMDLKTRGAERTAKNFGKHKTELHKVHQDFSRITQEIDTGETKITNFYYGITLLSREGREREDQQNAINCFRLNGFKLVNQRYFQLQSYLANLPFWATEGGFNDLRVLKRLKTFKSDNLTNILPVMGDTKGMRSGVPLLTARDQISFFDPFQAKTNNQNVVVTGESGSGKSFITNQFIRYILSQGGWVFIIDVGKSYTNLCQMLGGTYLSGEDISLNPFTFASNMDDEAEMISKLFAALCAIDDDKLSKEQRTSLMQAIKAAFNSHGTETKVDHIIDALQHEYNETKKQGHADQRILDVTKLLSNYATSGSYGKYFNRPATIAPDARLVLLELNGFEDKPSLLQCVLMALMMVVNERMYRSDRAIPKACVIDEAWKFLQGNHEDVQLFIETGYRTVRKYGGLFWTVAQGVNNFFGSKKAQAVWENSAIKLTFKQQGISQFAEKPDDPFSAMDVRHINSFRAAKMTGYSSFILTVGGQQQVMRCITNPYERVMYTTEPKQFARIETLTVSGVPLDAALMRVAIEYYPTEMMAIGYGKERLA